MQLNDQHLIDTAIARYRKKYPRLLHPQPSRHKSKVEGEHVILRNRKAELARYRVAVVFRVA